MLILADNISEKPIISLQTNNVIGTALSPIIDPRNLTVVAFFVETIHREERVLHTTDIGRTIPQGYIVQSIDSLMELDGLVRLQEVLGFEFELIGKKVKTKSKQNVGKVVNYVVESDTFYIAKIHVRSSVFNSITMNNKVIDRSQIISVDDSTIIVKDATIEERESVSEFKQARAKPAPQPETIES